jgi:hypothetical protein
VNWILTRLLDAWRNTVWPTCQWLFEQCVARPVRGLIDIASGLLQAVPAVTEAMTSDLSLEACCRIQQGVDQIARGWSLVQMPLALLVLVVGFGWEGLVLAVSVGSLLPVFLDSDSFDSQGSGPCLDSRSSPSACSPASWA